MTKILIVEDNEGCIRIYRNLLEKAKGYDVCIMTKPDGVFEKAQAWKPMCLIMDIGLCASVSGLDLIKMFKADATLKTIPLLCITAFANVGDQIEAAGADVFIPKPFSIEELLKTIDDVMTGKLKARE
jgi:DNA-binding response OmpR family regulator